MNAIMDSFLQTDWVLLLTKIILATALGYLIGLERELHGKMVGTRTVSLIAIGGALYVLMSPSIFGGDNSRIIAQVVSGIGFLGAGVIIFQKNVIRGVTTAAGLWMVAAIGLAAGAGMYPVSIAATLMTVICLEAMHFLHLHYGEKVVNI